MYIFYVHRLWQTVNFSIHLKALLAESHLDYLLIILIAHDVYANIARN